MSVPIEHYDFTTACHTTNNDTNHITTTTSRPNEMVDDRIVMIHPVTYVVSSLSLTSDDDDNNNNNNEAVPVIASISLFGPLHSNPLNNHHHLFHCQSNKGLFTYTSYDMFGNKNRIDNSCGTFMNSNNSSTSANTCESGSTNNHTVSSSSSSTSSWDSIVLWIQPNDITYSGRGAIITIGRNDDDTTTTTTTTTIMIRIVQYYSNIIVICETIQTLSNEEMDTILISTTTTTFLVKDYAFVSNQFTHIVLTVQHAKEQNGDTFSETNHRNDFQIYVNGQPMFLELERHDTISTTQNNDDDFITLSSSSSIPTLQLFSNHYTEDNVFLGSIYQLDIYNNVVTYDEVVSLYEHGVGYYSDNTIENDDDDGNDYHNHSQSAMTPYYYNDDGNDDDQNNYWYAATIDGVMTSVSQRPLLAKLSTTINISPIQQEPQIGFIVVNQNGVDGNHSNPLLLNTSTWIQLQSYNQSNPIMQLGIQITSLPIHGAIRLCRTDTVDHILSTGINHTTISVRNDDDDTTERILQENDIYLLYGNATSMTISYQLLSSNNHYFNIPTHDGYGLDLHVTPESLSYRIVEVPILLQNDAPLSEDSPSSTMTNTPTIIKSSEIVTMPIYVVRVNDGPPPMLTAGPYPNQQPYEMNNGSTSIIILNDHQVMVQDGIKVLINRNDPASRHSHNLDYVRVDVFSLSDGTITLNADRLILLSDAHEQCTQRYYSSWQCTKFPTTEENHTTANTTGGTTRIRGPDSGRNSITFVALPNDIPVILDQMIYTSHIAGQGGNITVRMYSGTGGNDCLHAKEHYWYYNITNPTPNLTPTTTGATVNVSLDAKSVIMDYMLARDDTCTKVEAILVIPNFIEKSLRKNYSGSKNKEFMIFGFVWKEWIFGMVIVTMFLFCFCGGCHSAIVRPIVQLLPTMRRCIRCCRRSRRQFNYNDYID